MTLIPIVVGILRMGQRVLEKRFGELEIRERIDTIQTKALLKSARIPRRVLDTCCYSNFGEKPPVKTGEKNTQGVK